MSYITRRQSVERGWLVQYAGSVGSMDFADVTVDLDVGIDRPFSNSLSRLWD